MEQENSSRQNLRKEGIRAATHRKSLDELITGKPIKNYLKNEKPIIHRYKDAVNELANNLAVNENKLYQKNKQLESSQDSKKAKVAEVEKLKEKVATTKEDIQTVKEKIAKREKSFLHKLFKGPYNTLTEELGSKEANLSSNQYRMKDLSGEILKADKAIQHLEKRITILKKEVDQMKEGIVGANNKLHKKIEELQSTIDNVETARKIAAKYPQVKSNSQATRANR